MAQLYDSFMIQFYSLYKVCPRYSEASNKQPKIPAPTVVLDGKVSRNSIHLVIAVNDTSQP